MLPDDPRGGGPRRYGDEEVRRLLRHATELQQRDTAGRRGAIGSGGITLATLQEVAAEAGIEPRYIQLAASRIDSPKPVGIGSAFAGTPLLIRAERVLPGELAEEGLKEMGGEIEAATDVHGSTSVIGRTMTWRSAATDFWIRRLKVTVASRNGETRIQAREELDTYAVTLFGGVAGVGGVAFGTGVGLGVGAGVLGSALFATLFPLGLIGSLYVAMRQVMKAIGRGRQARLEELVDRVAWYARPAGHPSSAVTSE